MKERATMATQSATRTWPWLRMAIALVGVLALVGCSGTASEPGNHSHAPGAYEGTEMDGPAPGFRLTDQHGASVALSDFKGRVVVLAFLDPNCTDVCPLTALHFRQAHEALGEDASRTAFLAVNVNPDAGSVADVAEATKKWGVEDVPSWHFLTGTREDLQEVWEAYGVHGGSPKPDRHGEVQHSPGVYLIDQHGAQSRYVSPYFEDAPPLDGLLVEHVRTLLRQPG